MAYTSGSWTVSVLDREITGRHRRVKRVTAKISLTATANTVPAAGIPLPYAKMGLKKVNQYILHNDHASYATAIGSTLTWAIDASGNTIKAYKYSVASTAGAAASGGRALRQLSAAQSIAVAHAFVVTAVGW